MIFKSNKITLSRHALEQSKASLKYSKRKEKTSKTTIPSTMFYQEYKNHQMSLQMEMWLHSKQRKTR